MTINVSKEVENSINAAVKSGRFPTADDAVTAAWLAFNQQVTQGPAMPGEPEVAEGEASRPTKPIWERVLERTANIPAEEWDKLPTDLAEQHDHYLYGTPKHPT